MVGKSDGEGSLLIRILSDSDIQKAIAFFSIALILAFAAVTTTIETDQLRDEISADDGDRDFTTEFESIYYPIFLDLRNSTLDFIAKETNTNFSLEILDSDFEHLWSRSYTLEEGEKESEYLPDLDGIDQENPPNYLNFNVTEGNLSYTYTVSYSRSPYGLLSLPAALFTLLGMVFGFRGKGVILGEIKRKQMRKKEKERREEREKKNEKEDNEDGGYSREVIYEGEKREKSDQQRKKGDASHIDFMGLPEEDKDDEL